MRSPMICLTLALAGCSATPRTSPAAADAGIDSLNAATSRAYRTADPQAYAALYTDSATFEWPAFNTVRGRAALAAMARDNWSQLRDMDLRLRVASRHVAPDGATEFGAFEQDYTDSTGKRFTEYGRYVTLLEPQSDGRWRIARFLGFEDSTRARR
ncbi:MAG TPA: DUF4440 domain-containing protein [Gemmatimonadaceae bacterium]